MKEGIHPNYYQATVTCNCGNTFVTGSTSEEIHVEICSKCHPFYTGQQKATQARGRVDKYWVEVFESQPFFHYNRSSGKRQSLFQKMWYKENI